MTRIRYKLNNKGILVSKSFKSPEDELVVNIFPDGNFTICNMSGLEVVNLKGGPRTIEEAKKLAKKALITLNIPFSDEVRPRTKDKQELYQNSIKDDE